MAPAPHTVHRTPGHTGNVWSQDYDPKAAHEARGGFGMPDRDERPGAYSIEARDRTGDDMTWRDAQYGASPLRGARYDEDEAHHRQHGGERGRYGQAPADSTEPEDYGRNTATYGNRL
mgnify:CR=1 FL=1